MVFRVIRIAIIVLACQRRVITCAAFCWAYSLSESCAAEIVFKEVRFPENSARRPIALADDFSIGLFESREGNFFLYEMDTAVIHSLPLPIPRRPDFVRVVSGTGAIVYCDADTNTVVRTNGVEGRIAVSVPLPAKVELVIPPEPGRSNGVKVGQMRSYTTKVHYRRRLWLSPSGDVAVVRLGGDILCAVDFQSRAACHLRDANLGPGGVSEVAFSPDGRAIAIASDVGRRKLAVVDLETQDRIYDVYGFKVKRDFFSDRDFSLLHGNHIGVSDVVWAQNGSIIAGFMQGRKPDRMTLRIWDAASGDQLRSFALKDGEFNHISTNRTAAYCLTLRTEYDRGTAETTEAVLIDLDNGREVDSKVLPEQYIHFVSNAFGEILCYGDGSLMIVGIQEEFVAP